MTLFLTTGTRRFPFVKEKKPAAHYLIIKYFTKIKSTRVFVD